MTCPGTAFRSLAPLAVLIPFMATAQLGDDLQQFTRTDSLRGSIGPGRAWWDVSHYDVSVTPDFLRRSITGTTTISFSAVAPGQRMQIDLQAPMVIDSITTSPPVFRDGAFLVSERAVPFTGDGNVTWVDLPEAMRTGDPSSITIHYHGTPRAAKNPPWDGGWIWTKDAQSNPWMSVACQGLGASVWYPCKDHQSDEPDAGAMLHVTVPDSLQAIGNGRLRGTSKHDNGTSTWHWVVTSPINTYNLVPYIGKYVHWEETYAGTNGPLSLDFWSLEHHASLADEERSMKDAKAREDAERQFQQVPSMLKCFEEWLGPYPFYEDGYKLVEAPHLGMEHQSAIAYGNKFLNGYLGMDRSGTGWGLKWDYIIIHESGHEWFGNSITTADIADMWVHEGFTDYTETIYTECQSGKQAGEDYVIGLRNDIANDRPLIGPYGVNQEGSGDMYNKGANLIHTIRHIVGDSTFKAMLLEMNRRFRHKVVTSADIEDFMINFNGITKSLLNKTIFDQYLRTEQVPVLEYVAKDKGLWMHWTNCSEGFHMPVKVTVDGRTEHAVFDTRLHYGQFKGRFSKNVRVEVDRNWYVEVRSAPKHVVNEFKPFPQGTMPLDR
jgi:aminopeptidase N